MKTDAYQGTKPFTHSIVLTFLISIDSILPFRYSKTTLTIPKAFRITISKILCITGMITGGMLSFLAHQEKLV